MELEEVIDKLVKNYPFSNVVLGFHLDIRLLKECRERLEENVKRFLERENVKKS